MAHEAEQAHAEQVGYIDKLIAASHESSSMLRQVVEALRGQAATLAVSEKAQLPQLSPDFPFAGSHRWLIPRQPSGGVQALEAGKPALVLADNPNRLGGYIVNAGGKALDLFLCDLGTAQGSRGGVGRVRLPVGIAWDLRLGPNLLWSGSVTALAGEASEVSVAEV